MKKLLLGSLVVVGLFGLLLYIPFGGVTPPDTSKSLGSEPVPTPSVSPVFSTQKNVKRITLQREQVVYLTGEVGEGVVELISKIDSLNKRRDVSSIYLIIDSPGGSVLDGARLVSTIESSNKPVYTVCAGICASMAAIIHQYGVKRYMTDRSVLMFHDASGAFQGPLPQMRSRLDFFDRLTTKMDAFIAKRAGMDLSKFLENCHTELWIDAEDSVQKHLNDSIVYIVIEGDTASGSVNALTSPSQKNRKNMLPLVNVMPTFEQVK